MEDTGLFTLVQRNDPTAFEQLFNKYSSELSVQAFQYIKQDAPAQDIVQEFFITLWQKRSSLQITTSFKAYAYKSIYHASLNYLRSHKRAELRDNTYFHDSIRDGEISTPLLEEPSSELMTSLQSAIDTLPAQCKKIFILVCVKEMKYAEVASYMGLSVNTVKVQMSKAYRILRGKMNISIQALALLLEIYFLIYFR